MPYYENKVTGTLSRHRYDTFLRAACFKRISLGEKLQLIGNSVNGIFKDCESM